jgi:predicted HicB family RNase H-like nuclease
MTKADPAKKRKSETKILTGFRIHPQIKEMATEAAKQDNRSFSNYLENLIKKDVESRNLLAKKGKK